MNRRGFNLNDPFEIIMLIMGFVVIVGCCAFGEEVERWDIFELELAGPSNGNPYVDVALGDWQYTTASNRAELDGKTGSFTCVAPSAGHHGPVGVQNTFELAYADGTPHLSWGTTCYAWAHQGDAMEEQTLVTRNLVKKLTKETGGS